MATKDSRRKVYELLKGNGYGESWEKFDSAMENPDKVDAVYDLLRDNGYGQSRSDFRNAMSAGATGSPTSGSSVFKPGKMLGDDELPTDITYNDPVKRGVDAVGGMVPKTEYDNKVPLRRDRFVAGDKEVLSIALATGNAVSELQRQLEQGLSKLDAMNRYGMSGSAIGIRPIEVGYELKKGVKAPDGMGPVMRDTEDEVVKMYLLPDGTKTDNKYLAQFKAREARRTRSNVTASGRKRNAEDEMAMLDRMREKRAKEVKEEVSKSLENDKGAFSAMNKAKAYEAALENDPELMRLDVAIHAMEDEIKTINKQLERDSGARKGMRGFWSGIGDELANIETWTSVPGAVRLRTQMDADKREGDGADFAAEMMYEKLKKAQDAHEAYDKNASWLEKGGNTTGMMLPFWLDFKMTSGITEGMKVVSELMTRQAAKALTKAGAKKAARRVGYEATNATLKNLVSKKGLAAGAQLWAKRASMPWLVKAMGVAGDDMLLKVPFMMGTVSVPRTVKSVVEEKLGDVVEDESGKYRFSNEKSWLGAVKEGVLDEWAELTSEMFGNHIDAPLSAITGKIGGGVKRVAEYFGAGALTRMLSRATGEGAIGEITKVLTRNAKKHFGLGDFVGEVSEEYYGQVLRTMLGLDSAYNAEGVNNLFDAGFHADLWGGMVMSMGLISATKTGIGTGAYYAKKAKPWVCAAATYYAQKAKMRLSEVKAKFAFGEHWDSLRDAIDSTPNEEMGAFVAALSLSPDWTKQQKDAGIGYITNSLQYRGLNLRQLAEAGKKPGVKGVEESYADGYNISSAKEMKDARLMAEYQRGRIKDEYGDDLLADLDADPVGTIVRYGGDIRDVALDYLNAKAVYDGMMARKQDDVEEAVAAAQAKIDRCTHKVTGKLHPATMKVGDRKVYVISGNVAAAEDGQRIISGNSDSTILICDAESGKMEFTPPDRILRMEPEEDAIEKKQQKEAEIRGAGGDGMSPYPRDPHGGCGWHVVRGWQAELWSE